MLSRPVDSVVKFLSQVWVRRDHGRDGCKPQWGDEEKPDSSGEDANVFYTIFVICLPSNCNLAGSFRFETTTVQVIDARRGEIVTITLMQRFHHLNARSAFVLFPGAMKWIQEILSIERRLVNEVLSSEAKCEDRLLNRPRSLTRSPSRRQPILWKGMCSLIDTLTNFSLSFAVRKQKLSIKVNKHYSIA